MTTTVNALAIAIGALGAVVTALVFVVDHLWDRIRALERKDDPR